MNDDRWIKLYSKESPNEAVLAIRLTDEGVKARNNGEKIDWEKGHYDCMLDLKCIKYADFS